MGETGGGQSHRQRPYYIHADRKKAHMAVRIRTSDGSAYVVNGSFTDLQQKVIDALAADEPFIEVRNGNNEMRSINPRLITSLEELPDQSLTPQQAQVLQAARDPQR
jgi:hypothetical protein